LAAVQHTAALVLFDPRCCYGQPPGPGSSGGSRSCRIFTWSSWRRCMMCHCTMAVQMVQQA